MTEYQKLMESTDYRLFLKEHADYAWIFGYDLTNEHDVKRAMFDEFLFVEYIQEVASV